MKKICVTYVMSNSGYRVETCITLPVEEKTADSLIKTDESGMAKRAVENILMNLAILQGYHFDEIETFEEDDAE